MEAMAYMEKDGSDRGGEGRRSPRRRHTWRNGERWSGSWGQAVVFTEAGGPDCGGTSMAPVDGADRGGRSVRGRKRGQRVVRSNQRLQGGNTKIPRNNKMIAAVTVLPF